MLIGYAQISTNEQNLDLQYSALKQAGCEKICEDKTSGSRALRPGLEKSMEHLREGDVFVIWKLDRLGRNIKDLINFVKDLESKKIQFRSLTDKIDTTTSSGRFFFHTLTALAQMERELIIERTKAGLKAAKDRGRVGGRKKRMTQSKLESAKKLLESGTPPKDVAFSLEISIPTLYRWLPASTRFEISLPVTEN
jgi:DNA invertase Pin-like site-specific DNA recombinase